MADTVKKLMRYIEANIFEDLSLKNIETSFNYSERHLRRVFKQNADLSIHPYITDRKMAYALFDLQTNAASIKDLYIKYGYNSHDSFSRAFKRTFNVSPKNYAKIKDIFSLKNLMPNFLTPIVLRNEEQESILKNLLWNEDTKRITPYLLTIDSFASNYLTSIIDDGFPSQNILNYNSTSINNLDLFISSFFNDKKYESNTKKLIFILNDNKTLIVSELVNKLYESNEICIFINKDEIANFESTLHQLQLLFNKTASIKFSTIISFFKPYDTYIRNFKFDSIETIKNHNFYHELTNFTDLLLLVTVNKTFEVTTFTEIVNHINKTGLLKVNISVAYDENQEKDFNLLLLAK